MILEWKDKYSVKVARFDEAHQKLIDMINEIHDNMKAGKNIEVIRQVVIRLFDYAESHFKEEELMMVKAEYPHVEAHRQEHVKFIAEITSMREKLNTSSNLLNIQLLYFLKDWLTNLIMSTDMKYSDFFNEKGIK